MNTARGLSLTPTLHWCTDITCVDAVRVTVFVCLSIHRHTNICRV